MRYNGTFFTNFNGALKANDIEMQRDLIVDQIATMIKKHPKVFIEVLNDSNIKTSDNPSKRELGELAVEAIYHNLLFRENIAIAIAQMNVV